MTDDLIARLRREAECWTPRGEMETLLLAAAEALAALEAKLDGCADELTERRDALEEALGVNAARAAEALAAASLRAEAAEARMERMKQSTDRDELLDRLEAAEAALAAASRPQQENQCHVSEQDRGSSLRAAMDRPLGGPVPSVSTPAAPPPWQPMDTFRAHMRETEWFFWCVPKTADETYCDTSGKPIVSRAAPYLHRGKYKSWGSLSKATHFMPLPSPPGQPVAVSCALEGCHYEFHHAAYNAMKLRAEAAEATNASPAASPPWLALPSPPASAPQPTEVEKHDEDSLTRVDREC